VTGGTFVGPAGAFFQTAYGLPRSAVTHRSVAARARAGDADAGGLNELPSDDHAVGGAAPTPCETHGKRSGRSLLYLA
jgi:hypothetical protein